MQSRNHIAAARARLAHLGALSARTEATERSILDAAETRLAVITADLDKLRPRVNTDVGAGQQYQALILESGHLNTVIAQARRALGA